MQLLNILKFLWNHPLNAGARVKALVRFFRWQIGTRILGKPVVYPWVSDARLVLGRGMTAATGNIYVGLMEFEEMAFILHYLRPDDVFFDIGANIGAYTLLAAKVVGARCLAAEPAPDTFRALVDNLYFNRIQHRATALNIAVGRVKGKLKFSVGKGAINHVLSDNETGDRRIEVDVMPLDEMAADLRPEMIKIDVEGFESEVVAGAGEVLAYPGLNVVLMELRGHGERYGFDESAVDNQMHTLGFGAYSYDPFRRIISSKPDKGAQLGDMLYIRNMYKAQERVGTAAKHKINDKWL
jgi:FkbM family methyltransferase